MFKTEPLYEDIAEEPGDSGFWASLASFFKRLWNPQVKAAEQLGFAYTYDEDGTLIGEYGSGGAQSTGTSQYIWLPTPNGPMPIVAIVNGSKFAVHSDHLNTPRKLTNDQGQVAWQWKYSAFGEEQPTRAANRFVDPEKGPGMGTTGTPDVVYNHRYPGQYANKESGLSYNYFRTYDADDGRYTQSDPIGLDGGWNRFAYVNSDSLLNMDRSGLQATLSWCFGGPWGCAAGVAATGWAVWMTTDSGKEAVKKATTSKTDDCCKSYKDAYESNSGKHGNRSRSGPKGPISPEPSNGATTLMTSVQYGDSRIGYDAATDEVVIFRNHRTDEVNCVKYWHGYVVSRRELTVELGEMQVFQGSLENRGKQE